MIVHSMDRLARNLDDLRRILQTLTERGVCVEFKKEQLSLGCEVTTSVSSQKVQQRDLTLFRDFLLSSCGSEEEKKRQVLYA